VHHRIVRHRQKVQEEETILLQDKKMEEAARTGPLEVTKAKKRLISQPNGRKPNLPTITAAANPIISNG
jgi:hypothetical protein